MTSLMDLIYLNCFRIVLTGEKDKLLERLDIFCQYPDTSFMMQPIGQPYKYSAVALTM